MTLLLHSSIDGPLRRAIAQTRPGWLPASAPEWLRNVRGVEAHDTALGSPWQTELKVFNVEPVLDDLGTGIGCSVHTREHQFHHGVSGDRRLELQILKLRDGLGPTTPGHHELTGRW